MKPGVQQRSGGRGGLQSLSYSGCTGWGRTEGDEPCLCLFPTHNMHRAVQEQRGAQRAGTPAAIPGPDSSTPSLILVREAAPRMRSAWTHFPLRAASLP